MIRPSFLQKGDTILVISPSGKAQKEKVIQGIEFLEHKDFDVILSEHALSSFGSMSASDDIRKNELQWALNHSTAKAIICTRGGYGCTRILDDLNWDKFITNPKWLVGFSDITAIHTKIQQLGIQSIHGPMISHLHENENNEAVEELLQLLSSPSPLSLNSSQNSFQRNGVGIGEIVGGNLALIVDQLGTDSELDTTNKILFIEEIGEYRYKIDRMMTALKRSGKLEQLAGLVIGQISNTIDNSGNEFPIDEHEIIMEKVQEYSYPVAFGFDIGHEYPNHPIVLGAKYYLDVQNSRTELKYLPAEV